MLLNLFDVPGKNYQKSVQARIYLAIALACVGAIMVFNTIRAFLADTPADHFSDFMSGYYTGFGAALLVVGIVMAIRSWMLLRDPDKMREAEIKANDERSLYITAKAASYALPCSIIAMAIALCVAGLYSETVFFTLLAVFFAYMVIALICHLVVSRRY